MRCGEVYVITHDSSFREPQCEITKVKDGKTHILSTDFPEIPGAIISCPSWEVHEYLSAFIKVEEGDATLLIGVTS